MAAGDEKFTIAGHEWVVGGPNEDGVYTVLPKTQDNLFFIDGHESVFLFQFHEAFELMVQAHVAGSYPLWCLLGRPEKWQPGDLDVFLSDEIPGLYDLVRVWAVAYPGATVKLSNTKIDVSLEYGRFPISFIFRRVVDAVRGFDLSASSVFMHVMNMWQKHTYSASVCDTGVLADIAAMRTRAHPDIINKVVHYVHDEKKRAWQLEAHTRLVDHLARYVERGFEVVPDADPKRVSSVVWYGPPDEICKRPVTSFTALVNFQLMALTTLSRLLNEHAERAKKRARDEDAE